jgi:hypothetical protein
MRRVRKLFFLFLCIGVFSLIFSILEPVAGMTLIDVPDAQILTKGKYELKFRMYGEGGLLFRFTIGINRFICFGVPLSVEHAIGSKDAKLNLPPTVWAQLKLFEGTEVFPVVSLGYYDPYGYNKKEDERSSKGIKGLYVCMTKPAFLFGFFHTLNLGVYTDIEDPKDKMIKVFGGIKFYLNPKLALLAEVVGAQISDLKFDGAKINAGIRCQVAPQLEIEFSFKDILKSAANEERKSCLSRILKIIYTGSFR